VHGKFFFSSGRPPLFWRGITSTNINGMELDDSKVE
jgi:hypothetical protein